MRTRSFAVVPAALALALATPAAPASAHGGADVDKVVMKTVVTPERTGEGTKMAPVANLQYKLAENGATSQSGSDIEFGRIGGRDYAFAGTLRNGMQIIDITTPTKPRLASVYDCRVTQGDVQVFRQGSRVLATYTADSSINTPPGSANRSLVEIDRTASACVQEARKLGFR